MAQQTVHEKIVTLTLVQYQTRPAYIIFLFVFLNYHFSKVRMVIVQQLQGPLSYRHNLRMRYHIRPNPPENLFEKAAFPNKVTGNAVIFI